jgi:hypothetical protein
VPPAFAPENTKPAHTVGYGVAHERSSDGRQKRQKERKMFGRKSLPIGVMVLLLIVALASLGVAYGNWNKTLYIDGTVETGWVDAEMSIYSVWDVEDKDVGTCEAWLGMTNQANDTLFVTVENAYPSYECYVTFDVHNTGTIPLLVHSPVDGSPPEVTVQLQNCYAHESQIHYSEMVYCTLYIHPEQAAEQNATYTFGGTVLVHQWNEEPH